MISKGFCSRCEASFVRHAVYQIVGSEGLDQSRLAITASAHYYTPYMIDRATALDHVNCPLFAGIFSRWRAGLYGIRHFRQFFLLLSLRQWPDLFFKHFLGGCD